ncbi:hypothetical protein [Corallococcus sp. CA049B]|uniref:hypothetical protein n=1 Tax=Corallococcus sp. CA049B TaxID=2316730 RepID=UPI001F3BAF55|nr:hypothetical protein [Corallococcus sp. CA049B]
MKQPQGRDAPLADESSAKFTATLDLAEPRLVTVEVSGPLAQRQALATSTPQLWLLPGKHLEGDGLILELPGFVVDVLMPSAHEFIKLAKDKKLTVPLRANLTLMCGGTTEPKGLGDSSRYELQATVKHNGKLLTQPPLKYAMRQGASRPWTGPTEAGFSWGPVQAPALDFSNAGAMRCLVKVRILAIAFTRQTIVAPWVWFALPFKSSLPARATSVDGECESLFAPGGCQRNRLVHRIPGTLGSTYP